MSKQKVKPPTTEEKREFIVSEIQRVGCIMRGQLAKLIDSKSGITDWPPPKGKIRALDISPFIMFNTPNDRDRLLLTLANDRCWQPIAEITSLDIPRLQRLLLINEYSTGALGEVLEQLLASVNATNRLARELSEAEPQPTKSDDGNASRKTH